MASTSAHRKSLRHAGRGLLFWKLFATFSALGVVAVLTVAAVFVTAYERLLARELDGRLIVAATSAGELLADEWPKEFDESTQSRIRQLGQRAGVRLTLIDLDGVVLADSLQRSVDDVRRMENHAGRAEFIAARAHGVGDSRHASPTVQQPFHYHALRVDRDGAPIGVIRTALPTAGIDNEISGIRRWTMTIGGLVALTASVLAFLATARLTDPLRDVVVAARSLAAGQFDRPLPATVGGHDEFSSLARSLNELARHLAEREGQLRSTSQTQTTVLEGMSESVIAVDRAEHILFANASAGRILGFDPPRVQGRTLLEAVRSHELRDVARRVLRMRQASNGEIVWRGKTLRTFDVLATPLPGEPTPGVVLVLRDVSEVKRLEQMRHQFIANVSHELKTPLSSIKAYAETLLAGARNDPEACERFLGRIEEQAARLQALIQDMLTLARIESSHAALQLASIPAARVVRRCLADYEPQAAAKDVALVAEIEDPGLSVRADEEALRQILSNLVDNALKYTPAGGRVTVRCTRPSDSAVFAVIDTGVGIPAEHHARLFERFYRVDKARSRELGGTGLGLAIVKHLAQAMGGAVAVTSEVDAGSTFTVTLPLASESQA